MANYKRRKICPLDVRLDPENPRLEPEERGANQEGLRLTLLRRFKLDDLGNSIVASGYTDLDPLVTYEEEGTLIVREGNRRIGALQLLLNPELAPQRYRSRWQQLSDSLSADKRRGIKEVSVRVYDDSRAAELEAYIGFRHVSGVLEWPSQEKAGFIVDMVDRHGWNYDEIAKRLGSYPHHVERHYIASRLISQAEELGTPGVERIQIGVLLRALQATGISQFLGIIYPRDPAKSRNPVPEEKHDDLKFFVRATFGTDEHEPILPESRKLTKWGTILTSEKTVAYLRSARKPSFERAWIKSGGESLTLAETLNAAADNLEDSIPLVPDYKDDPEIIEAVDRCARRLGQILRDFPEKLKELCRAGHTGM